MSIGILDRYWPDPGMNFILFLSKTLNQSQRLKTKEQEHLPVFSVIISFNLEEKIEKRHKSSSKEKGGNKMEES